MRAMNFDCIHTERLTLRKVDQDVVTHVHTHFSDEELMTFLGLNSLEEVRAERVKFEDGLWTFNKKFLIFHILEKSSDRFMGWCGYHTWYTDHDRAEIGYWINDETDRGKGFMTEAIQPIIDYGFEDMNLNRIEAFVSPTNPASIRVLEARGFVLEGTLREHYFKANTKDHSHVYGLLKSERF